MTTSRFLIGLAAALVALGPLALGAGAARRRLVPSWTGAEAFLVDLVLFLTALTLIGEALGTVGQFRLAPLMISSLAVGAVAWWRLRPADVVPVAPPAAPGAPVPRESGVLAGVGIAIVAGSWLARTVGALARGMNQVDTLWYHLPLAANFVQSGRTTGITILDGDSVTAYFPATSSLLHAMGFLFFDTDLVSTVVNLGWFTVALMAAWSLGRAFGAPATTAAAAALVLGTPGLGTQAGGALTDVVGLALLLTALAIWFHADDRRGDLGAMVPMGLALGLSVGTKFTFLAPVAAIALGAAISGARGARVRRATVVVPAALLSGGYWYFRNLILGGTPIPSLGVAVGPIRLPSIPGTLPASTVASLVVDTTAIRRFVLPGFREAVGPAWVLVLAVSAAGILVALRGPDVRLRLAGAVTIVSWLAFVFTPQYLFGGMFFGTNLRYGFPALMLGTVLLPMGADRHRRVVSVVVLVTTMATQFNPVAWSIGFDGGGMAQAVPRIDAVIAAIAVVILVIAIPVAVRFLPAWSRRTPVVVGTVLAVVAIGLIGVHDRYLYRRYQGGSTTFPEAARWIRGVSNADIGVVGQYLVMKYPFYGPDRTNRVRYIAIERPDHSVRAPADCTEWTALLVRGGYDYVAINTPATAYSPVQWTERIPGVERVLRTDAGEFTLTIFRLPEDLEATPC